MAVVGYFTVGEFKPTEVMGDILDIVDKHDLPSPAVAAGVLAHFVDGCDFRGFVQCLREDGLTDKGLIALAQAALAELEDQ